jgi:hypothetical protein
MAYGTVNADVIGTSVANSNLGAGNATQFKNRIINGAMVIDQRNAGASVTPTANTYTLDRWRASLTQASKFSVQQNAGSVTLPTGFTNYLGCTSLSAYSVLTSDAFDIRQFIEGYNVADLEWGTANAKTVTLSFWVRSSLTGTFGGSLRNSAANRSYPYSYTISAANTWEQKSITIAGDTTGTWLVTNGTGIIVTFSIGTGANLSGTAGAWAGANYSSATGATSVVGTNGATFYITGVQLEVGESATGFDYRPYGTELALCQRYYYKLQATGGNAMFGVGYNESTTSHLTFTPFPVSMRAAPSALEQSGTAADYRVAFLASAGTNCNAVPTFGNAEVFSARTSFSVASGLTAGQSAMARSVNSSAYLAWSAEL